MSAIFSPFAPKSWGIIFTFAFILLATSVQATVRYVKTDGSDSNTGLSWAQAYLTVQKALETAVSGDEIWVKAGTYLPTKDGSNNASPADPRTKKFTIRSGVSVYGGFNGAEMAIGQRDWVANTTILSGDIGTAGDNSDNCYNVVNANATVTISTAVDGFTITLGNANGTSANNTGGGMKFASNNTQMTVANCIFSANVASGSGGAMYVSVASPTLTNCTFSSNSASSGGGLFNTSGGSPSLTNCIFIGNSATVEGGGMMNNHSLAIPVLTNCLFTGNSSQTFGSALLNANLAGSPTLINCTFSGNNTVSISGNNGGALTNYSANPFILKNCLVWNNRAGGTTGSADANMYNNGSTPTITYSLIQNQNPAGTGNLNGIPNASASNYPAFTTPLDPATAPSTAGDFHLTSCSPGLNLGTNTGAPTTDLFGNSRPFATTVDLGVHELQAAAACPASGTVWFVNAAGTTCNSGTSWACAFQNVQDAINAASSGHEIWVKAGTYFPTKDPFGNAAPTDPRDKTFYLKDGVKVYGGFAGMETLRTQRNWTTNPTTLSGDLGTAGSTTDNAYHVVLSVNDGAATELDGFKIEKGNATAPSSITVETKAITRIFGGGMFNTISSPTVSNCVFSENNTDNYGGGMYNAPSSSPSISNCSFLTNTAAEDGGGMINYSNSNPTLTNCIFSANVAGSYGGGMINSATSNPTLTNCSFTGNDANVGGGMRNHSSSPSLTNCVLSGNRAVLWGGGMANSVSSDVVMKNCIIWNNRANSITGSVDANFYTFSSTPVISYSLIQNHNPSGTGNLNGIPNAATSNYPSFVTPLDPATAPSTSGDFHITNCSPVLNLGTNTGAPTTDLFGNSRPFATTVDLGVHELQAAAAAVPTITCPANQTGTNPYTLADFTSLASTTGTCTPISITQSPAIGTSLAIGMHTITLTATASNGATATCSFTVTVNSNCPATGTVWYVNPSAASGGNGASWACGFQNVQDAINAASSSHEIWVKAATYLPTKDPFGNASPTDPRDKTFYLKNGVAVYGGFAGTETLRSQRNWTTNPTILSGDIGTANDSTDNCYHVVLSVSDASTTVLDGFSVTKANASGFTSITVETKTIIKYQGGGLNNNSSSLTVANCTVASNKAYYGGGAYNEGGSATYSNCTFTLNNAKDNSTSLNGGGMYNQGATLTLTDCTFSNNTSGYGGGIFNQGTCPLTLTGCNFLNNYTGSGGGIYNASSSSISMTLSQCKFSGNTAWFYGGGGIYNDGTCTGTATNCLFSGNKASAYAAFRAGSMAYTNCTFSGNWNDGANSNPTIFASSGSFKNCVIWNNRSGTVTGSVASSIGTSTAAFTYSLVQAVTPSGTGNLDGTTNAATANYPSFVAPLDPTTAPSTAGDFHIQTGSPLANAGTNTGAPSTDLFGNLRPSGASSDIGVHELLESCPTTGTIWYVNASAASGGNGASWACGFQNLQDAINAASSGHEIWVKTGTYLPTKEPDGTTDSPRDFTFYLKNGVAVYGGFDGAETMRSERDWVANPTILSGDIGTSGTSSDDCCHVVLSVSDASTTVLDGFTVTNGNANVSGSITVETKTIERNFGGGMNNNSSFPTIANCAFSTNLATGGGGAMFNNLSSPAVSNCAFSNNTTSSSGGGMYNTSSSPTMANCVFSGNSTDSFGGGMYNASSNPTVANCVFSSNSSGFQGGGMYNSSSSSPTVANCTFSGNSAIDPGNPAFGQGGAIKTLSGTPIFYNCTFYGNTNASTQYGSVSSSVTSSTFTNCAFYGNGRSGVGGGGAFGGINTITYSIGDDISGGTGNFSNVDPLFVNSADPDGADNVWGTADDGLKLQACSKALNSGTNTGAPATDFFGSARPFATTVDMGMHELQSATPLSITCPSNQTGTEPYTLADFTGLASTSGTCTPISVTQSPAIGTSLAVGAHTITLTATASNGATATCTFTVTVNSNCPATGTVWYVNPSAASGGNGASWACGFQNLQDAINAASSGHEIWVKTGTYLPTKDPFGNASPTDPRDKTFYLKNGVAVYGGFDGTETMRSERDWAANPTILSGDIGTSGTSSDDCCHVVLSVSDASTTVLDGFTVTNGNANVSGSIMVETKTIERNFGGGMQNNSSSPTIANCVFSANLATSGGAMLNILSSPAVSNCAFSNNTTSNIGGAMTNLGASNPTLTNCTFTANSATNYGGAMENNTSDPTLTNCTFVGNSSANGGAMDNYSGANVILTNCLFSGNSASSVGGGMYNLSASPNMTNCTFSGNKATTSGGAMQNSTASPTLKNCLIWNNRAGSTTGSADASMTNSTATPTISYSLIQNHNPSGTGNLNGITNAADSNFPNFTAPLDPATAPSTSGDFHIETCSPVVNKGTNTGAPTTDLFGNTRPFGTTVDMGVHELQSAPTPVVATCQNITVNLDGAGNGTLSASSLNNGSTGCATLAFSASQTAFTCSHLGPNTVTLTVTGANGSTGTCTSTVTVADPVLPNALCRDFVKNLGANGTASITMAEVDNLSNDNCGTANLVSVSPNSFTCTNIGANTVTLTVNDGHGNVSTCNATVTVSDATAPTAVCQNISVNLNSGGAVSITAAQVNNGSSDNCGVATTTVAPSTFGCANVGVQTVTLTVTDVNSLASTCAATVTVADATNPTALCQNVSVNLNSSGTATITTVQVNNGSSDNCGIASLGLSTSSFSCASIGANTVTLTATDNNGRTATCTATVTIADATNPTAVCQNITVNLDGGGNASITGAQVDGGSTDNCGIASRSAMPNAFTTSNLGANTVTLTVTDNNSRTATCTTVVTVTNTNLPNAVCQPYTAVLGANGSATITAANVDGGSTAVGGIASMSVLPSTLTCANIGTNTVTLTVTGNNGLTATCNASVTVQDNTPPTVVCQNIAVNLSGNTASITASQILNAASSSDNCGTVNAVNVVPNSFNCNNLGANTVTLTANDGNGNAATCAAAVTVSDATPPTAICQNVSVNLNSGGTASVAAAAVSNGSTDNCGTVNLVGVSPNSFTCSNIGANTVALTVNDGHGNTATCLAIVTVVDNLAPSALCRDIVAQLDGNGNASITAAQVNNGSSDNCALGTLTVSPSTFTLTSLGVNTVTLTVPDANGNSSTCTAQVTVENNQLPNAVCQNISRNLGSNGLLSISAAEVDGGSTAVGGIASMSVSPNALNCSNLGVNTVSLTVVGNNGQQASCNATVTVADVTAPTAICQNVSVNLNAGGTASITAAQVNNGSADACGVAATSVSPNSFACANLGPNTVTLTVTDVNSLTSTCLATVTVSDITSPTAICQNVSVNLNSGGTASVAAAAVNNGSTDNCGTVNLVSVSPNSFTCSNIGANTVTLTVNDGHGNTATCVALVMVEDHLTPTAVCQNVSVNLNSGGTASITAVQVNNGSSDNCGVATTTVSPSSFACANIGAQTVTLTVTDVNSLVSTCTALVMVADQLNPTAVCQNVAVDLNSSGTATVTAAQVNNGSSDNCGIASLSVLPNTFACANVGPNTVTLTVTDNNNRTATCTATVTVADATNPTAVCQNITVNLDGNGNASITGAQVDGGSSDNCGIASRSVTPNTFTASNLGANTVTLTVTDNNSRTATCTAVVTVTNTNQPNAVCQPYTAVLGTNGSATITAANVDGGSTAVGGIASMSVSPSTLTCANLGTSTLTLTVTGNNGLTATCTATVTVQDNTAPTAVCQNVSVNLSGSTASIAASQILNAGSSTDNCGSINAQSVSPNSFICSNLGANTVTLTVNDGHGNAATCTAIVTVSDATVPTAVCQNVSVNLSGSTASITASQVFNAGSSSDNCGSVNAQSVSLNSFTCSNLGANTVMLTANDGHGNAATCTAIVTVSDATVPTAVCQNVSVNLSGSTASIAASQILNAGSSSDNCGSVNAQSVSPNSFSCSNIGMNTVTLTVNDGHGNAATCTAIVTVSDATAPTAVCQNVSVNLSGSTASVSASQILNAGSSSDNCGSVNAQSVSPNSFTCSNLGPNTVTLTVNDGNGNAATCTAVVTVSDATVPTAVCQNVSVNLSGSTASITASQVFNAGSSSDNCGSINAQSVSPNSFSCSNIGMNTVTLTVNDGHGNAATCTAIVTVSDATAPTAVCQNISVNLSGSTASIAASQILNAGSSSDNCGSVIAQSVSPNSFTCSNLGANTVTLTVNDGNGNAATCTAVVTVSDATAPTAVCQNVSVNLSGSTASISASQILNAGSSSDNCGSVTAQSVSLNSFTCSNLGMNAVTLTVNDGHGNTATCTAVVTVQASEINLRGNGMDIADGDATPSAADHTDFGQTNGTPVVRTFTVQNDGMVSLPVTGITVTGASAFVAGPLTPASPVPAGQSATFTVTYAPSTTGIHTAVVNIASGDCDEAIYNFDVKGELTCSAPTFTACPTNLSAVSTSAGQCSAAVGYTVSANGLPIPNLTYALSGATVGSGSGSGTTFNTGTTTVTVTATNPCGTPTCSFTVTVLDNQNPSIVCPDNISKTTDSGQCSAVVTYASPTFSDNCSGVYLTRTSGQASGSAFTKGTHSVNWQSTDLAGNSSVCNFSIMVTDGQAPNISCPANIVKNTDAGQCTAVTTYANPTYSDNCAGASAMPFSGQASGTAFTKGTHSVTWQATDGAGLTKRCTFTVTVNDTQTPTVSCPASQTKSTDAGLCTAVVTYTMPTFADNCVGGGVAIQSGLISGSTFPKGQTIVVWRATDMVGLTKTCSFKVTVNDNQAPAFTLCPSSQSVSTDAGQCTAAVTYTTPMASDNCTPPPTVLKQSGLASGSNFPKGSSVVVWKATDGVGLTKTCSFTITVTDTQLPTITCPSNIAVTGSGPSCNAVVVYASPTATDNCAITSNYLLSGLGSGAQFSQGVTTNTWKATDNSGLTQTCAFTVTVGCGTTPETMNEERGNMNEQSAGEASFILHRLSFILTPNPATTEVRVMVEGLGERGGDLTLFDAQGRVVWQQSNVLSLASNISVADLPSGLYFVTLRSEGRMVTKRLMVQRL